MFMQRIEVSLVEDGAPRPKALKLGLGLLFLAASLVMMPPYFLALGASIMVAAAIKLAFRTVELGQEALLAGELVTGR